jgi:competence protein ComGC
MAGAGAFTLVEVLVLVAVVGLLLGVMVPAWAKSRDLARAKTCVANLRLLHGAKLQWAAELKKDGNAVPTCAEVRAYLRGGTVPACPTEGVYRLRRVSKLPVCSFFKLGHTLSPDSSTEDALPD